ncbi:MAG: hypothetical protein ACTSO9_15205 [Candidatus Helarchaeota archaeon]
MINSYPYFGFIIGTSCVVAGILITIISGIGAGFLNGDNYDNYK